MPSRLVCLICRDLQFLHKGPEAQLHGPPSTVHGTKSNMARPMATDDLEGAFRSKRLWYKRVNKGDDKIRAHIISHLNDPISRRLSGPSLLRPQGDDELEWRMDMTSKSLLGVAICLLPSELPEGDYQEPVVIGCMDLGPGGIHPAIAHNRSAEIGISIGRDYQNKGYGAEALNWLLDWAFQHAGLHTVQLSTSSYNERAVHLYQKLGFVLEGRRRECFYFRRQWYDGMEFGMTEGDWARIRGLS